MNSVFYLMLNAAFYTANGFTDPLPLKFIAQFDRREACYAALKAQPKPEYGSELLKKLYSFEEVKK
jgi:hypothetical protein